jgi:hypothetical protein
VESRCRKTSASSGFTKLESENLQVWPKKTSAPPDWFYSPESTR